MNNKSYVILAKWDYAIDLWLGGISDNPDHLMDRWNEYLDYYGPNDTKPELIKIVELNVNSDLSIDVKDYVE